MDTRESARPTAMPKVGDVLRLRESDYCYGTGPLTLRVTEMAPDTALHPALEWLSLRGVEIGADGGPGPERHVLVRTAALAGAPRQL
nr:hypothetical protein [Micromonospora sp. DSM 115978]